jgi:hypothetical protein
MLFLNRQSWAHCLKAVGELLGIPLKRLLSPDEIASVNGLKSPQGILF